MQVDNLVGLAVRLQRGDFLVELIRVLFEGLEVAGFFVMATGDVELRTLDTQQVILGVWGFGVF